VGKTGECVLEDESLRENALALLGGPRVQCPVEEGQLLLAALVIQWLNGGRPQGPAGYRGEAEAGQDRHRDERLAASGRRRRGPGEPPSEPTPPAPVMGPR
jgi:hypothetical protein